MEGAAQRSSLSSAGYACQSWWDTGAVSGITNCSDTRASTGAGTGIMIGTGTVGDITTCSDGVTRPRRRKQRRDSGLVRRGGGLVRRGGCLVRRGGGLVRRGGGLV